MRILLSLWALLLVGCMTPPQRNPKAVKRLVEASPPLAAPRFQPLEPKERHAVFGEDDAAQYRVGPGDVLRVLSNAEFLRGFGESSQGEIIGTEIKPDGNIYLPVIGAVPASGRTVVELQVELTKRLGKYSEEPFVSVDVMAFRSQKFHVLGAVTRPSVYHLNGSISALESLGLAGGLTDDADLEQAYVVRDSEILAVSLADMVLRGDMSRNIRLRNGDMVFVPHLADQKVYVVGEVKQPGPIPMERGGLTLAAAVTAAGGFDADRADPNQVRIFRGGWGHPLSYTLSAEDVYDYGESIRLRNGDRVIVAPSSMASWNRTLSLVLPFVTSAAQTAIAAAAVANLRN